VVLFTPLSKFVRELNTSTRAAPVSRQGETSQADRPKKHILNLDVDDTSPNYFIMLSSTYFMPLSNGILQRNPELVQKNKE